MRWKFLIGTDCLIADVIVNVYLNFLVGNYFAFTRKIHLYFAKMGMSKKRKCVIREC